MTRFLTARRCPRELFCSTSRYVALECEEGRNGSGHLLPLSSMGGGIVSDQGEMVVMCFADCSALRGEE